MQVLVLEEKLGALHATDANALRRSHRSLGQHIQALALEVKATQAAADKLDGNAAVLDSDKYVTEVRGQLLRS